MSSRPEARYSVRVSATMHTAKETVRRLLDGLPDNASMEDILFSTPEGRAVAVNGA
jgi:hypothetical protein